MCSPTGLRPLSAAPAQYSPCHSPSLCLYSPGPHTAAWVLGEHVPLLLSCHCAPQCQIPSGKGPGPRPCCYFWPGKGGESKGEELEDGYKRRNQNCKEWERTRKSCNAELSSCTTEFTVAASTEKLKVLREKSNASSSSCSSYSHPKRETALTSLLISSCLSGAERAVALIMVDVWLSVSFLIQRWPATMLQTYRAGRNISLISQSQSDKRNNSRKLKGRMLRLEREGLFYVTLNWNNNI